MNFSVNYSNSVENLAQKLAENLSEKQMFSRKILVTPNEYTKNHLQFFLADRLGISFSASFLPLEEAMDLLGIIAYRQDFYRISRETLSLYLQCFLLEKTMTADLLYEPMRQYLGKSGEEKIYGLADTLAQLFLRYATYGYHFLKYWLVQEGWKQDLFKKVFANFDYPLAYFTKEITEIAFSCEVHFFYLSALPPIYLDFLEKMQSFMPINFYLFSPSPLYWGDFSSNDKQSRVIKYFEKKHAARSQLEELRQYLKQQNPIVSNYAKLGQYLYNHFHEKSHFEEEIYQEPQGASLLKHFQYKLFSLADHHLAKEHVEDQTIQLHRAPSKYREIEILYHNLLRAFQEDPSLQPHRVLVMASDIAEYYSLIRLVFESGEYTLPYAVADVPHENLSHFFQGLNCLLSTIEGKLDFDQIRDLFSSPNFQQAFQLTEGQVQSFLSLAKDMGVTWGFNPEHREKVLGSSQDAEGSGTWEFFFQKIFLSFAMAVDPETKDREAYLGDVNAFKLIPDEMRSLHQGEYIGDFYEILARLHADLELVKTRQFSLKMWIEYFMCFIDAYLAPIDDSDEQDRQSIIRGLSQLQSLPEDIKQKPLKFFAVKRLIKSLITKKKHTDINPSGIHFCSFKESQAAFADLIYLIGMNENSFPNLDRESSLDELSGGQDFSPKRLEYDSYSFLQVLSTAKRKILISYDAINADDGKPQGPSSAVSDLFDYLDEAFDPLPSSYCIHTHPLNGFDEQYFRKESSIKSFSNFDYRLCELSREDSHQHHEVKRFKARTVAEKITSQTLHLQQLMHLARSPARIYINYRLGTYLEGDEEENTREFLLHPIQRAMLKKQAVHGLEKHHMKIFEISGKTPIGLFKKTAERMIEMDSLKFREHLSLTELLQIQWSLGAENSPQKDHFTPLCIALEGVTIALEGTLSEVSSQGILSMKKAAIENLALSWPQILLLFAEKRLSGSIAPSLIFLEDFKTVSLSGISWEDALREYLQYFFLAKETISPLHPQWIKYFLKGDYNRWQKTIRNRQNPFTHLDPYTQWLAQKLLHLPQKEIFQSWSQYLNDKMPIFSAMLHKQKNLK